MAFGPKPRRYTIKVNRKARRKALRAALSMHAARHSLAVVDADAFDSPSTRAAIDALAELDGEGKVLLVLSAGQEACAKSFRNAPGVSVVDVGQVGIGDIVGAARLVLSRGALERLVEIARPLTREAREATGSEEAS